MSEPSHQANGDEIRTHDYLAQHGEKLLANGYHIVPIRVGGKAPGFDGWEKSRATVGQLKDWMESGHRLDGVGVLTKNTPAIDIDIRDEEMADLMEAYVRKHLGGSLLRIGQKPKRAFLFRCDKPFRKMRTTVRKDDEWDQKHQIEVLAEGQQVVVFHKHPDTGLPYYWPDEQKNPLEVSASELPTLEPEQIEGLFTFFEQQADKRQWKIAKAGRAPLTMINGADNPYVEDTAPVDMPEEECHARILLVQNPEDYEQWITMGMALHHQWDGGDQGLAYWHEWSESADNYDADSLERRWADFNIQGKKRAPITFRWVLKMASEALETQAEKLNEKLRDAFINAKTKKEWDKAAKESKEAEIDGVMRSALAQIAKASIDKITGVKTTLTEVKRAIAYKPKNDDGMPGWADEWVYDTSDDRFFATAKKLITTRQGFDAMFDRYALTKKDALEGKTQGTSTASDLVLRSYRMTVVNGRRYEPGRDPIFHSDEGVFANTYSEVGIPDLPEVDIPRDRKNVDRVKNHIAHLLESEVEQRMFLDWISWVVQNPGQHVNYSILLQGVEGDGKSFWAELLRAVMGPYNVQMLNAHIFENDFTDWAQGQCVSCVEEVRIVKAQNKYEVINRVKPFITNKWIEIHPKGKPIYNTRNTTSYLLFSNFKDALPLDDDGRRFLVLFSQWQRKAQLMLFKEQNPNYYVKLYGAIEESAGAIRNWLLKHEQHGDFNPMGDAPVTGARQFMVKQAKPEFVQIIDELVNEDEWLACDENLINVTDLPPLIAARGAEFPHMKTLHAMLQRAGWEELGKVRMGEDGRCSFWSKMPEMFRSRGADGQWVTDGMKIKKYVESRKKRLEEDEL